MGMCAQCGAEYDGGPDGGYFLDIPDDPREGGRVLCAKCALGDRAQEEAVAQGHQAPA